MYRFTVRPTLFSFLQVLERIIRFFSLVLGVIFFLGGGGVLKSVSSFWPSNGVFCPKSAVDKTWFGGGIKISGTFYNLKTGPFALNPPLTRPAKCHENSFSTAVVFPIWGRFALLVLCLPRIRYLISCVEHLAGFLRASMLVLFEFWLLRKVKSMLYVYC